MKLLKDNEFISRKKVKQLFLATSIMVLGLYVIAMICSLLGLKTFILNYQNSTMDKIEEFLHQYSLYPFASDVFLTIEFFIVLSFVLQKHPTKSYTSNLRWNFIEKFTETTLIHGC